MKIKHKGYQITFKQYEKIIDMSVFELPKIHHFSMNNNNVEIRYRSGNGYKTVVITPRGKVTNTSL